MFILQIQRREVESHLQAAMRLHLDLACVKLSDTQKKFEETTKKLEERVNALEEHIHFSEPFVWKIDGFREALRKAKRREVTIKESSPFYRGGYKCKLQLYPNGDGVGKNTHLSICFIIIKGEYDAMFTWPFEIKVTFTLVDQHEYAYDRNNIVQSTTVDSKLRSFFRLAEEDNFGLVFRKFVSHEKLCTQGRRYILDDAIFIKFRLTSLE